MGKLRVGNFEWKNANPDAPYPEEMIKRHAFAAVIYMGTVRSDIGRYYYENYRTKNKAMPAALVGGLPTDMHFVAGLKGSLKWPEDGDDYAALGCFRGEPLEVVESETIPGLMVPAQAEWVIEVDILPEDEIMPPFAEDIFSGHIVGGESCPILRVRCMTYRKDFWWADFTFSSSGLASPGSIDGHEGNHSAFLVLNGEIDAINFLRRIGMKVKDVVLLDAGREVAVVQLECDGADKPHPHYGKQVLMGLHGNPGMNVGPVTKYLIVVGPDINPYDFKDVMWAVGVRSMPVSDSIMIEKGLSTHGDPGAMSGPLGWKAYGEQMMIDALIKVPERFEKWPPRSEPVEWEKAAVRRMRELIEGR